MYTDNDVKIYDYKKPVWANGIPDYTERPDLADRSIMIHLPVLKERISEKVLEARFAAASPKILGALLNSISAGLGRLDATPEASHVRMADGVRWINACLGDSTFANVYDRNREDAAVACLDTSPVTSVFLGWWDCQKLTPRWHGTASDLLRQMESYLSMRRETPPKGMPQSANALSNQMRRMAGAMRLKGIDIQWGEGRQRRDMTITSCPS